MFLTIYHLKENRIALESLYVVADYNLMMTLVHLHLTSDASKGAPFMTADIKNCVLVTPMAKVEYMKVKYKHITEDIRKLYNLN